MKNDSTKMCFLKSHLLLFSRIFLVGIFLLAQLSAYAQQLTITGKITDSQTGETMPGVNIVVKGSTIGTITSTDGKYSITVPDKNAVLAFSFIGYSTMEIPVEGKTVINVTLVSEALSLEEVVVVGYGTQSRRNITGSVASANMKKMEVLPVTNISQAFRGTVAGVQFT